MSESWADFLTRLFTERFSGSVTLHFDQGTPKVATIPVEPVRIVLTSDARPSRADALHGWNNPARRRQ